MYRHQAASAINPAPSGAISYRSRLFAAILAQRGEMEREDTRGFKRRKCFFQVFYKSHSYSEKRRCKPRFERFPS
jgi:hypothetical protein